MWLGRWLWRCPFVSQDCGWAHSSHVGGPCWHGLPGQAPFLLPLERGVVVQTVSLEMRQRLGGRAAAEAAQRSPGVADTGGCVGQRCPERGTICSDWNQGRAMCRPHAPQMSCLTHSGGSGAAGRLEARNQPGSASAGPQHPLGTPDTGQHTHVTPCGRPSKGSLLDLTSPARIDALWRSSVADKLVICVLAAATPWPSEGSAS